jgi:8-oxo-dGTP diphosphatase
MNKQIIVSLGLVIHEGKVLLTQRRGVPDKWELPGGKVEFGEDPSHTAIREVKEETGYDVVDVKMIPLVYSLVKKEKIQILLLCYECIKLDGEITYGDSSVSKIQWFDVNELPFDNIIDGSKDFILVGV